MELKMKIAVKTVRERGKDEAKYSTQIKIIMKI